MELQETAFVREAGEAEETGIFQVRLETGVLLTVRRDGSARGNDGKTYFPVLREFCETFRGRPDRIARVVGWSSELDQEKILPPEA